MNNYFIEAANDLFLAYYFPDYKEQQQNLILENYNTIDNVQQQLLFQNQTIKE